MPQLELLSWFFNFLISWSFLLIVFSLLINKNIISNTSNTSLPPDSSSSNNNWLWN